mmetsp:Transcript_49670/g.105762  ORF Transcript_49670/g.105762 Transcript_49670/m.105762 type:complete len:106 (+) Transcript_49670:116-433(+)
MRCAPLLTTRASEALPLWLHSALSFHSPLTTTSSPVARSSLPSSSPPPHLLSPVAESCRKLEESTLAGGREDGSRSPPTAFLEERGRLFPSLPHNNSKKNKNIGL